METALKQIDSTGGLAPVGAAPREVTEPTFDWRELVRNPQFIATAMVVATLSFAFISLFRRLTDQWFEADSLYSHGPLVPLLCGAIVWSRWETIKRIPVKGSWLAVVVLAPVLYVTWIASRTGMQTTLSALFLAAAFASVWFVAGRRWVWALTPALLYMTFALPVWGAVVDRYTQPMQKLSTDVAVKILQLSGLQIYRSDSTTVMMDNFSMNVEAACSGTKLTLALCAFTVFFILIGRNKLWANAALVAFVIPLCLLVNGARIAMVGAVGNSYGQEMGHKFHDYGGYISLILCFFLLRLLTRTLGFKS